ncbi:GTP-binding protein [Dichanthelium oligosanthes]|uniref:GTP-binding protein n=1 Tax=Dichanthelium oligosanthes TaxID=888268 RepID=A0A1E5VP99_9POAL|nr:GTP-binding protein [Dichanthelium oligosanthes]
MLLRPRPSLLRALAPPPLTHACVPTRRTLSAAAEAAGTASAGDAAPAPAAPRKNARKFAPPPREIVKTALFLPPGVERDAAVTAEMVIPGSNIVVGPYAGDARVKKAEIIYSAGKTQTINHFLVNKSWYLVDLPGYGFAAASQSARMDWSSFTKGYFLNRDTLVSVLLLIDASIPPQKIDLDCANWLGRNNIGLTFVFTKCDKVKKGKGGRPDENIKVFQETISGLYPEPPPWIMTSSVTGLGRDGLLLHMSQLRNYWDNETV